MKASFTRWLSLCAALAVSTSLLFAGTAGAKSCGTLCVQSADGMMYRVLGEFHYTDVIGQSAVGFAITVTNNSRRAETFEPFPGFTAQLSTGGDVQYESYESRSAADPDCAPVATQPGVITPLGYHVKPGRTGGPWEICMALSQGQTVVKAVFADDNPNLHQPAIIELRSVPQLRTPLPSHTPPGTNHSTPPGNKNHAIGPAPALPNPCRLSAAALENIVSASAKPSDGSLHTTFKGTAHETATCRFPVGYGGPNLITTTNFMPAVYLGYVRPADEYLPPNYPENPSARADAPTNPQGYPFFPSTAAAIPGFPHASLIDTFDEWQPDDSLRWIIVNFTRRFDGRLVYGQIATTFQTGYFRSCPAANLDANVESAAVDLYKLLGPGSAPSPSLPRPLAVGCPGQNW